MIFLKMLALASGGLMVGGGIVHLLLIAVVLALVCYLLFWLLGYLGTPEPIRKVVTVIVVVLIVLWLLSIFLPIVGVA
jgi:hypothetical protein